MPILRSSQRKAARRRQHEPQSTLAPEAEDVDLHGVAVAEAELVFPEIEVEVSGEALEPEAAVQQPGVIPSQARVRVAGAASASG